jgi:hypothetical protein
MKYLKRGNTCQEGKCMPGRDSLLKMIKGDAKEIAAQASIIGSVNNFSAKLNEKYQLNEYLLGNFMRCKK